MPAFVSAGARATSASASTITPVKPTTVGNAGGVLLAVITTNNNATHSTATLGWTRIGAQVNSGAGFTASLWIAAQAAANPVFTWTGAAPASAQISYYWDVNGPIDTTVAAFTNNNGTANPHTTAAFNSTRANALAVYVDVVDSNASALATPAGWTEDVDGGTAAGDVGRTAFGSKILGAAGSSSGAISVSGASAAWVQWQVELTYAPGDGLESSKLETGAWYEPEAGVNFSKLETGTWYEPDTGLNFSKLEVGAWLEAPTEVAVSKMEVGAWLEFAGFGRRRQMVNPV